MFSSQVVHLVIILFQVLKLFSDYFIQVSNVFVFQSNESVLVLIPVIKYTNVVFLLGDELLESLILHGLTSDLVSDFVEFMFLVDILVVNGGLYLWEFLQL